MARQQFYHDPSKKHIETLQDFSLGLNTVSSNDNLKDQELTDLVNVDLGERGSLKRRKGFTSSPPVQELSDGDIPSYTNPLSLSYTSTGSVVYQDYATVESRINAFADVEILGRDASDTYNIYAIHLGTKGKPVVSINGAMHGSEYQTTLYSLGFAEMLRDNTLPDTAFRDKLLQDYHFILIPTLNPWGLANNTGPYQQFSNPARQNVNGIDLNNNFDVGDQTEEETRVFMKFVETYQPFAHLDAHMFQPDYSINNIILGHGHDELTSIRDVFAASMENQTGDTVTTWVARKSETSELLRAYVARQSNPYTPFTMSYISELARPADVDGVRTEPIPEGQIYGYGVTLNHLFLQMAMNYLEDWQASVENLENSNKAQGLFQYNRRYNPYNLLSYEGEFDGLYQQDGTTPLIGEWRGFNFASPDNVYKAERDNEVIIVNGGFEDGTTGWVIDADDSLVGASSWAYYGDNVLRMKRAAGSAQVSFNEYQENSYSTKPGYQYYMEMRYRKAADHIGGIPERVQILAAIKLSDGSTDYKSFQAYDVNDTWQKLSGIFEMPENAVEVTFGVGLRDAVATTDVAAYFDQVVVQQRKFSRSSGDVAALRSVVEDTEQRKGLRAKMDGMKPSAYYIYLTEYKADTLDAQPRLGIVDENNIDVMLDAKLLYPSTEWKTGFMKFKTNERMDRGRAYVYNYSETGIVSTVFYDKARIYEVSAEEYEKIGDHTEYIGEALAEKFPYKSGQLKNETIQEEVIAHNGNFYINGVKRSVENDLDIQSERPMEAVQFQNNLYIASGSGMLVYNGSTIARVPAYYPKPLESLYVGTNALNPNSYEMTDEEGDNLELKGVTFDSRYGVINEPGTITAYVWRPYGSAGLDVEFKFQRRRIEDMEDYWFTGQDWSSSNSYTFLTDTAGVYEFRVQIRKKGEEAIAGEYVVPKYIIKPSGDTDSEVDGNTIDQCNRIFLHWNRLIMYGDESKPDVIYISDLNRADYFPVTNTLQFENPKQEPITKIIRFRDNLVVFTETSIQALYGKSPKDFQRITLNTDVGCIAPETARVMKNYVTFLSYEGLAILKSVGTSETRANIDFIDKNVKSLIYQDKDACALIADNQYHLVYPTRGIRLRFYYEYGIWTKDESPHFDFMQMLYNEKIFALGLDGRIIEEAESYTDDDHVYPCSFTTKFFDFGEPYAVKKTKELQTMVEELSATSFNLTTELDTGGTQSIDIALDGSEIYKNPVPGKGLSIQLTGTHNEAKPFQFLGVSFIFKLKNP